MTISSSNERKKNADLFSWMRLWAFIFKIKNFFRWHSKRLDLVGSAHQITSVLQGIFCRSWWGRQTLSAEKGPVLLLRLGDPITSCASGMLLDFSQSRLLPTSCVPAMARGFPLHHISLSLSVPGIEDPWRKLQPFSLWCPVLAATLTVDLSVLRISADKRQLKG